MSLVTVKVMACKHDHARGIGVLYQHAPVLTGSFAWAKTTHFNLLQQSLLVLLYFLPMDAIRSRETGPVFLQLLSGWDTQPGCPELSATHPSSPAPLSPAHNSITPFSTHRLAELCGEHRLDNCMRDTRLCDRKAASKEEEEERKQPSPGLKMLISWDFRVRQLMSRSYKELHKTSSKGLKSPSWNILI